MTQRISRASGRLRQAGAPVRHPVRGGAPGAGGRRGAHVCHLVFTEGYTDTRAPACRRRAGRGGDPADPPAPRALPDDGEVAGAAGADAAHPRALARADRRATATWCRWPSRTASRWQRDADRRGRRPASRRRCRAGMWAVPAAGRDRRRARRGRDRRGHRLAPDRGPLRDAARLAPGPAVTLNHAVAAAMVHGPDVGLAMLDPLGGRPGCGATTGSTPSAPTCSSSPATARPPPRTTAGRPAHRQPARTALPQRQGGPGVTDAPIHGAPRYFRDPSRPPPTQNRLDPSGRGRRTSRGVVMTTDRRIATMEGQNRHIEVAKPYDEELGPLGLLPGQVGEPGARVEHDRAALRPGGLPGLPAAAEPVRRGAQLHPRRQGCAQPGRRPTTTRPRPTSSWSRWTTSRSSTRSPSSTSRRAPSPASPAPRSTTSRGCSSTCSTRSRTASTSPGSPRSPTATPSWRSARARSSTGLAPIPAGRRTADRGPPDLENNRYLAPYKHFHDAPFKGTVDFPGFPGFDPVAPHLLLDAANTASTSWRRPCWSWTPPTPPAGSRTSRSWSSRPTRPR